MKYIACAICCAACMLAGPVCLRAGPLNHLKTPKALGSVSSIEYDILADVIVEGATQVDTFRLYDQFGYKENEELIDNSSRQSLQEHSDYLVKGYKIFVTGHGRGHGRTEGRAFATQCAVILLDTQIYDPDLVVHSFSPHYAFCLRKNKESVAMLLDFSSRQMEVFTKDEHGRTTFKVAQLAMGRQASKLRCLAQKAFPLDAELRLKRITYQASQLARERF